MGSSTRRAALAAVAAGVPDLPTRRVCVAVDGVDGAGKTTFGDELADEIGEGGRKVVRASIDRFHSPDDVRFARGRDSAEGFWRDSYDLGRFIGELVEPFAAGRPFRRGIHDVEHERPTDEPWETAPAEAVLVVDGIFLHRDELTGLWDFSVFLEVPFSVSVARWAERDGRIADPDAAANQRFVHGQQLYLAACTPSERATAVVDNTDLDHPEVRWVADSR